jgi:hypothetical protein
LDVFVVGEGDETWKKGDGDASCAGAEASISAVVAASAGSGSILVGDGEIDSVVAGRAHHFMEDSLLIEGPDGEEREVGLLAGEVMSVFLGVLGDEGLDIGEELSCATFDTLFEVPVEGFAGEVVGGFEDDMVGGVGPGVVENPHMEPTGTGLVEEGLVGSFQKDEFEEFVAESVHVDAVNLAIDVVKEFGGKGIEVRWHRFS